MKKPVDYISASQIGTFLQCPLGYKHVYLENAPKEPPNIYMAYGTAVHHALAYNNLQKVQSKKDLITHVVTELFESKFQEELDKIGRVDATLMRVLELEGETSLVYYMQNIASSIQPLYVEYKFTQKLKNFPITIHGYIDLITEDGYIIDYKTVGKSYKQEYNQRTVDNNMQLTFYSIAYRKEFNKIEKGVCIDLLPRCKPFYQRISSTRSKEQHIKLLNMATDIEKIIDLGVFIPNFQQCSKCQFNSTCNKRIYIEKLLKV